MKKILPLLLIFIFLTACSEVTHNDYKFVGESEHWEAEYAYKGTEKWRKKGGSETYSNEDHYELTIKYKGTLKDLSATEKLEYSYETISSSGVITETFTEPPGKAVFTTGGGSEGGAKVSEDEIIKVTVKWDGYEESFELQNKNR